MADQNFDIDIKTRADLSGVKETERALNDLKNKTGGGPGGGAPPGGPDDGAPPGGPGGPKTPEEAEARSISVLGRIEHSYIRAISHFLGIAAIYGAIENIKRVAEEINKIAEESAKAGAQIVENSRHFTEAARGARSQADAVKIGTEGLKDMRDAQKELDLHAADQLNLYRKITDEVYHFIAARGNLKDAAADVGRIDQKALDEAQKAREQNLKLAEQEAVGALRSADISNKEFEKWRNEPVSEAIKEITAKVEEWQKAEQKATDIQTKIWDRQAAEDYKKTLSDIIKLQEQQQKLAEAQAKPLAKGLLAPTGEYIDDQIKANREHQAERAALEQKRLEAVATGDNERANAIQEELKHDRFGRDQRKEQLQRYVANQESLFRTPGAEGPAEMLKDLGTLGKKKYEAAQAELSEIYKQERGEGPKALAPGGDTETHRLLQALVALWQ